MRRIVEPSSDPAWLLEQEGFTASQERHMESLFAIGNGTIGVRGSPALLIPSSQGDLFIAGVYDRKIEMMPYSESEFLSSGKREGNYSELVPFPFPFRLEIHLNGAPLSLMGAELAQHKRKLDLHNGIYFEEFAFADNQNRRLRIATLRCASLVDPHLLLQEVEIFSENYTGPLSIGLSMRPQELELAYPHLRSIPIAAPPGISELSVYDTRASKIRAIFASRIALDDRELEGPFNLIEIIPGKPIRLSRYISVHACVPEGGESPNLLEHAFSHIRAQNWNGFSELLRSHSRAWHGFWERSDVRFKGRPEMTHVQRFNLYQLRLPASHSEKTSIGARALTGRAYEGHVFWDTTIFMFPFFLYTKPDFAREMVLYRYHTLSGARARASAMHCKGACYAWESTITGEDVTPSAIHLKGMNKEVPVFTGTQQIHVTADVAFSAWKYWDATLDIDFLSDYVLEILVETARFWSDRCVHDGGAFQIRRVIGPDEYHFGVDNNAYTNWMARFNLEKAAWALEWLMTQRRDETRALIRRLALPGEDPFQWPSRWRTISSSLFHPDINSQGVIEQFDGFFRLKDAEIREEQRMKAPITRLFAWDEINRLKIVKQADVLMIPFLFSNALSSDVLRANYEYYEPKTDHGSSLSTPVHAAIAARVGDWKNAERLWNESIHLDLRNTMRNTPLGIHVGCMGGSWQALVFHMLGITLTPEGPRLPDAPWLPDGCEEISLDLVYRGRVFPVHIRRKGRRAA